MDGIAGRAGSGHRVSSDWEDFRIATNYRSRPSIPDTSRWMNTWTGLCSNRRGRLPAKSSRRLFRAVQRISAVEGDSEPGARTGKYFIGD